MSLGLGVDPRCVVIVVGHVRILGEPITVRAGIVQLPLAHHVTLGLS